MPTRTTWTDWLGQNPATDVRTWRPGSVDELAQIVSSEPKLKVIGAGHADNRVARPDDGTAMIDPTRLDEVGFEPRTSGTGLVRVAAGARIREVNDALDRMGRGLVNMGSFDEQTISGAFATGTHGSGAKIGPLCDSVRAVELVDGKGQRWRVDDPDRPIPYSGGAPVLAPGTTWVRDDRDLFRSLGVHAGALGVVTALVIDTLPAYQLWERRLVGTWEGLKPKTLLDRAATFRHYEVLVVPQPGPDGTHAILETFRDVVTTGPNGKQTFENRPPKWPAPSPLFERQLLLDWARLGTQFVELLEWRRDPDKVGGRLAKGLDVLSADGKLFVGRSDQILMLRLGARAHGFEMAVPVAGPKTIRDVVATILERAADWNRPGEQPEQCCVSTSPFALRFVKASPQFLAPQSAETAAGTVDLWCMIEIPRLWFPTDQESARYPHYPNAVVHDVWHDVTPQGVRPHWGQFNFLQPGDLPRLYPNLAKWQAVAARLDPDERFVNAWDRRVGLR
jgi:hypothetical protein